MKTLLSGCRQNSAFVLKMATATPHCCILEFAHTIGQYLQQLGHFWVAMLAAFLATLPVLWKWFADLLGGGRCNPLLLRPQGRTQLILTFEAQEMLPHRSDGANDRHGTAAESYKDLRTSGNQQIIRCLWFDILTALSLSTFRFTPQRHDSQ